MSQAKHTPGPWSCRQTGDGKRYVIGDGQSAWGTHVAEVYSDDTDADEAEANAKLVQAAPKLAALLREAISLYGKPGGPWNVPSEPGGWLARAREALGDVPPKAEGEVE